MDKDKKEPTTLRGIRGSRGARVATLETRGWVEEKSLSPKSSQPPKNYQKLSLLNRIEEVKIQKRVRNLQQGDEIVKIVKIKEKTEDLVNQIEILGD